MAFFFKQWGGVRKKVAGRTLRGRTHEASQAGKSSDIAVERACSACFGDREWAGAVGNRVGVGPMSVATPQANGVSGHKQHRLGCALDETWPYVLVWGIALNIKP